MVIILVSFAPVCFGIQRLSLIRAILTRACTGAVQRVTSYTYRLYYYTNVNDTRSSAIAERPRVASCLPVVSFNSTITRSHSSVITVTSASVLPLLIMWCLRSASTSRPTLVVPVTRLSTVGDRAFLVAAARVWNSLPADVTSSPSLSTFKRRLKTELFVRSYP